MEAVKKFFHNQREKLIAVLGQGYIAGLMEGTLSKSVLILSDQRLYSRGKIFNRLPNGKFAMTRGSAVVSARDITGTSYQVQSNVILMGLGIGLFLTGIFFTFMYGNISPQMLLYIFLPSLLLILFYYIQKHRLFIIEYAGGSIATNAKWYSIRELSEFQKAISLLKDRQQYGGDIQSEHFEDLKNKYNRIENPSLENKSCPECSKMISISETTCPECGFPNPFGGQHGTY